MKKFLICIDGDGTLKNDNGEISKYTNEILKNVTDKGHYVVLTTGRPRYHAEKICESLGGKEFSISSNGAEIYDNINKKVLKKVIISSKSVIQIYNYAKQHNININIVTENKEYVNGNIKNDSQLLFPNNTIDFLEKIEVKQLLLSAKENNVIRNAKKECLKGLKDVKILNKDLEDTWISIGSNLTSKGEALKSLANFLNLNIENTIAIGNDFNDLSMFKTAGISVVTNNAKDDIKQYAKITIDSNNNDGVAKFLNKLLLNE